MASDTAVNQPQLNERPTGSQVGERPSQQLIPELLDRARTHIDRHDFPAARQTLTEIFDLQFDHPEAARLKSALDAAEAEANMARTEKEKFFTLAQRHHRNGELDSALTQLEKLLALSRNVPSSSIPEREKDFEAFHAALRSERAGIDQSCTEAAQALAENNFEKALAICDSLQARYPNNPEFQALRLKAQQAQRQQLLSYAGEVARSVEAEPNLDGRVCLLQEAVKRYPNEELLARQLSLACEQRDLAASIVAKARAYELQGQFAEALHQWKALMSIHPLYPGLAAEIQQLEQRREQTAERDKSSQVISEINRALASGAYPEAERLSQDGLRQFPEHPQLLALQAQAQQGSEKCRAAEVLLNKAKTVRASGDLDQAMTLLRQALNLDPRQVVARNTLVHLLLERARTVLANDASAAESLAAEAAKLYPEHASVQKVLKLVTKTKRKNPPQPALLEAAPAPQPTKLFLDDFIESSRAPQQPQRSPGSGIFDQFREIGSVLVFNIKSRLFEESDLAPLFENAKGQESMPPLQEKQAAAPPVAAASRVLLTPRQIRGFALLSLGALAPLLLFSFASRYGNHPPTPKPVTAPKPEVSIAPPPPPVTMQTAPSYASVATEEALPEATVQTVELPATPHPIVVKMDTKSNRRLDTAPKAPLLPHFTISSGTPGASVIVDDLTIGQLDEKGNFSYAGITAGTHKIEFRKPGYASLTFFGQRFLPGKSFDLPGNKHLPAAAAGTAFDQKTELVNPREALKLDGR